ncbi:MAG: general secretion pathway protein GspE [Desulfobacteraceae bacterium 4572_123]|nr:MAG: general secretion pathway protein GspE [Desulfobacteraceae bacterium 4572_123]
MEKMPDLSSHDISIIKQTLGNDNNFSILTDKAAAFLELGLTKEAAREYEKAFDSGHDDISTVFSFARCLLKLHPISTVADRMKELAERLNIAGSRAEARILYMLGMEARKQQQNDQALELFKSAQRMNPDDDKIRLQCESAAEEVSSRSRYDDLLKRKLVTAEQLNDSLGLSKKQGKSVEMILIEQFNISREDVGRSLSRYYGCPFKPFDSEASVPAELIRNLKQSFLLHDHWVPISWSPSGIDILLDDPKDIRKTDHIKALIKSRKITLHVGIREDVEKYIRHFFKKQEEATVEESIDDQDFLLDISFEEEEEIEEEVESLDESTSQVVKLVDQVLVRAFRENVSDIHIEPSPISRKTAIRFRLDGVCQEYISVPISMARGLVSRLKIMANLDIAERRLPQDGKIKFHRKEIPPFELRMATLPTAGGFEDVVLRILAKAGAMKLSSMGLSERNYNVLEKTISRPYGLILAVGPTGSGKTTTLHAALGHINKPEIKIWTAEDPVEISQLGLRQVEVKPKIGLNFARVMRAFLRADPDVIMIGEMRDNETAAIGIEASLTGHLVFSTLHTNNAPETITRLLDMGLNPLNFSDAFLCVLAQRLVRKLCTKCRKAYHPSREEFDELAVEYDVERFKSSGIKYSPDLILYRAAGCSKCSGSGYKGRMGIHELMEGTPMIKKMIKKQAGSEELFMQAAKEGMDTLKQDGIMKVFQGLTDFTEIRRVCIG